MPVNNFKPYAIGVASNVVSQGTYEASGALDTGFPPGGATAPADECNKAWRQATVPGAALCEVVKNVLAQDVLDNADFAALVAQVLLAIQTIADPKPVALTDAATINTDASLSNTFRVTLGGNRTLANPTNMRDGQPLTWKIKQDGTGGRTLAFGSKFKAAGSIASVVLSTAANAIDHIAGYYDANSDAIYITELKAFS